MRVARELRTRDVARASCGDCWSMNKVGIVIITHQTGLLKTLSPNKVHIISGGKIVRSGKMELIKQVEKNGYKNFV